MSPPTDQSTPALATGVRWGASSKSGNEETRMILAPERALKLQGTGKLVLEACDGQRTFGEIIAELQKKFDKTDPEKIRSDISVFLERLQKERIVDY